MVQIRVYTPIMKNVSAFSQAAHEACVCGNVRKAARAITQFYDDILRPSGLRITQFGMLGAMMARGPITVTRLAEATVTDRTTLTRNLKLLEEQGLIRIDPGSDRREREVSITRLGSEALKKGYPLWEKAQTQITNGLGAEHLKVMRDKLTAVTALARKT